MARLPSALDLSGPASFRTGRMYATADMTAAGRGISNLGDSIQGVSVDLKRQQEADKAKQNAVDVARAEAAKTEGLLKTQNDFDFDPDYPTYGERAPKATGEVVRSAAGLIRDPEMRERWEASAAGDAARVNDGIFDRATTVKRQAETNAFDDALETNRRIYVDPETGPEAKAKAKADIEGAIATGVNTGLLSPDAADARRKTYIEDAEFSRGALEVQRDPSVISKPLPKETADRASSAMGFFQSQGWTKEQAAGIVGNLMGESRFNTTARNPGDGADGSDSIGIAQWNGARARALKAYAGERGLDWHDFGVQLAFVNEELKGSERAAGDKLRSAKTIDEATAAFLGYERPAGWSEANPRGGHNFNGRLKFAAQAAGQEVNPEWYQNLSPENRQKILDQAQTRQNEISVETRGAIDVAVQNAPTAIMNTGSYTGSLPTAEQFTQAYGPQDGSDRYNNFVASLQTGEQIYSMRTMPSDEIQEVVRQAMPTSSGDDAAIEQKRYEALSSAASATIKAREADPAQYARQAFPGVDAAWREAGPEGGYQEAVTLSVAAQEQLGIKNIQPLPKDVTANSVARFKDESLGEEERISAVTSTLMSTPDAGQRRMLFEQLVDAGLPDITEGAFEALSRGDTGAGRRLLRAAITDPSKLPGQAPEKPAVIDEAIQAEIMDEGQIGDIYYGLSDGTAENFVRAGRDSKLITNAVNLRMRNGEDLDAAIAGASKDLYGDVKAISGDGRVNAQVLVPTSQDEDALVEGLASIQPLVRDAMVKAVAVPGDAKTSDGTKAILDSVTQSYIENVLAEGYFRNSGNGFVFIDPYVGAAVADETGAPVVFTTEQVLAARPKRDVRTPSGPLTDDAFDRFQRQMQ